MGFYPARGVMQYNIFKDDGYGDSGEEKGLDSAPCLLHVMEAM